MKIKFEFKELDLFQLLYAGKAEHPEESGKDKARKKAEVSFFVERPPCLKGLVRSEAEYGSEANPGRDG